MNLRIIALAIMTLVAFSCTNKKQNEKEASEGKESKEKTEILQVSEVIDQPENYVDKKITIDGMVIHVCKHGGKKLHVSETDSDQKLRVKAGEGMPPFEQEIEGNTVQVTGKFTEDRIDQDYIDELKKGDSEEHHEHEHEDEEKEEHKDHQGVSEEYISELEEKIEDSEKGYISEYWLIADEVEIKDE
ncbi:MAG: hypothetical protein ACQESJ_00190 [Bacteroidota bacterium]